jgi:GT2 family glycosyltransferase
MAFRRTALLGVGGFDPAFGAGTPFPAEDWDAVARVCMNGWDGGYFPEPTVSHHHGRTASDAHRQLATYHYASGAVYAKLVSDPATRRAYRRYWARRILGDSKYHHRKLVQQFRGAIDYWRSVRRGTVGIGQSAAAPRTAASAELPIAVNPWREP